MTETPLANFIALTFPLSIRILTVVVFSIPGANIPTKEVVKPNIKGRNAVIMIRYWSDRFVFMTHEIISNYIF